MNELRMLDKDNADDVQQLAEVLQEYSETEEGKVNQVYVAGNLFKFSNWITEQFKTRHTNDFIIYGSFHNKKLMQIMVAYKFEVAWGNAFIMNNNPYWYVGLAYFRDRCWRNPGIELINLGLCLGAHFEKQGYHKFYTVKKMPRYIKTNEDLIKYISNSAFKETYQVVRYNVSVEKVFKTQEELSNFRFNYWSTILPRGISRPVMLLEFTLDPMIDIKELMKSK